MPVVNTETEITEPAFGYKLHGRWTTYFEFQFLNVYLVHRHVSCLPVQLFPPHNCVRKKQVEIFHRCRLLVHFSNSTRVSTLIHH